MVDVMGTLVDAGLRKPLDASTSLFVTRSYADLELFISRQSIEMHAFIASWESPPKLEDMVLMYCLSFADHGATGIILTEEAEERTV